MQEISSALKLNEPFTVVNAETLPSCFAVSDLAAASIGSVGSALASLIVDLGLASSAPQVNVDQRLASLWFSQSIEPLNWEMPPIWDAIAGDYKTQDGWIKLHTNLSHHRQAALSVLKCEVTRDQVAQAVVNWNGNDLETAVVEAGGVAAMMRTSDEWRSHPQGMALASEPLVNWNSTPIRNAKDWAATLEKPLQGLRVLDLTRVLAGPVSTRTLAAFGADVLRIDPPGWNEANVVPDITLGKRCAHLKLSDASDRKTFEALLSDADILVHGYRPGALDRLGYTEEARRQLSPNLIEVSLDAYGWSGPWALRRGFDSLVQMSCGIADTGRHWLNQDKPTPLPVQALDHATGYLMAAAVIQALRTLVNEQQIARARVSLARTAELLKSYPQTSTQEFKPACLQQDFSQQLELTPWGKARRLKPPLLIMGSAMQWDRGACELGSASAEWSSRH